MTPQATQPSNGLIISAPSSRAGKTTVALGLMRLLTRNGLSVQAFKSGPDYIDTAFHTVATGRASANLDAWAMHSTTLNELIATRACEADIAIVEGAMGLFDGAPAMGQCAKGSTADIAALTGWPVVLVLDVARQTETAAAIAKGCATYRNDITVAGVILNNVASERHERLVRPAVEALGLPVLACVPRSPDITLPERHLGLVQARESKQLEGVLDDCANLIEQADRTEHGIDKALMQIARPSAFRGSKAAASNGCETVRNIDPPAQTIAIASDEAFSFVYNHVVERWRRTGANIAPFSPLADEPPSPDAGAIFLPGGYPELHAARLANASRFREGMLRAHADGIPIHGECGGYMVLGRALTCADGIRHEMLGLLELETTFATRMLHLGYRKATLSKDCIFGKRADTLLGHEFHYASIIANDDAPLASVTDASGHQVDSGGSKRRNVSGTFFHFIDRQQP